MMFITAALLYSLLKMQHSGNILPEEYIDATGTVYLKIPGGLHDIGKVTVNVKGTQQEVVAVADEDIERGEAVKIVKQLDGRRFLVKKL